MINETFWGPGVVAVFGIPSRGKTGILSIWVVFYRFFGGFLLYLFPYFSPNLIVVSVYYCSFNFTNL